MFDQNRRRFPRANYPCQLTLWLADGLHETILANTSNVGTGGLCVHLNQEILAGARVDIQLHFKNPSTPFKCGGTVVRCTRESEKYFTVAVQFEPLNELKAAFLEGKIAELIELEKKGAA